jgi:hypothetical protein
VNLTIELHIVRGHVPPVLLYLHGVVCYEAQRQLITLITLTATKTIISSPVLIAVL